MLLIILKIDVSVADEVSSSSKEKLESLIEEVNILL